MVPTRPECPPQFPVPARKRADDRHSTFKELAGAAARFAEFAREAAVALNIAPRDA